MSANLALLLPQLNKVSSRPEWHGQIKDWKTRLPFSFDRGTPDGLIKPQNVIEKLSDLTAHIKDRTIIATGVSDTDVLPCSANIYSGWPAPNVGGTAFQMATTTNHDHLWWTGYNGFRSSSSDWRKSCKTRLPGSWYVGVLMHLASCGLT